MFVYAWAKYSFKFAHYSNNYSSLTHSIIQLQEKVSYLLSGVHY